MSQELWTAVDQYITDLFVPFDPVLEAALRDCEAAGMPAIAVSPNQGKMLMLLAQMMGAKKILEIGTLGGYSAIWLARSGAQVVTLERDPKHAEVARTNIARAGLSETVEVRVGKALDTLPGLLTEAPFDLFFIDADKPNNPAYLGWALKLSRKGSVIVADNVVRDGAVIEDESEDPNVHGIRRFHELLAAEARVSATAIQTVGSKGYDGFAMGLVL